MNSLAAEGPFCHMLVQITNKFASLLSIYNHEDIFIMKSLKYHWSASHDEQINLWFEQSSHCNQQANKQQFDAQMS